MGTDIYAARIDNSRTGWKGWLPAVRGGWQRGVPHERRDYLPLTTDVLAAHLRGESLEPHQDQWRYLSTLGRMTPREVSRAADVAGRVRAGSEVTRLAAPVSTKIRPEPATMVRARLGAGIRVEMADLTPALAASLRHAASMHNPRFYEKQRMRASTWDIPRFLQFFDETIDGGLIVPRGHAHHRDQTRRAGSQAAP